MLHLFKSAASRAVTYSLMAVVAVGLLIGAVRLALPFADLFRTQIADALGETLGLQVSMSRFRLRLAGMAPRITLEDVDLRDPQTGDPQLQLMSLHLDLNLRASLRELAPQVESLTLEGASLQVERRTDGTITVAGLDGVRAGNPDSMTFFLRNGRFLLMGSDILWVDDLSDAPDLELTDVQIRFDNDESHHRIGLRARLPDSVDTHLHLAADLRGDPQEPRDWSGDLYLDWRSDQIPQWLLNRLPAGAELQSGPMAIRNWNRIADSRLVDALVLLNLQGLNARTGESDDGESRLRATELDARLHWLRHDEGWRLEVPELTVDWASAHRSVVRLGARFNRGSDDAWTVTAGVEGLALTDLREALPLAGEALPVLHALRGAELTGDIRDLYLRLTQPDGEAPRWAASGRVLGLKMPPRSPLPGVSGLDLRILAERDRGQLELSGKDARLEFPLLFEDREPLEFFELSGPVGWKRTADGGFRFESPGLTIKNADLSAGARLRLDLPPDGRNPNLMLSGELRDADVRSIRRYVPVAKLKPKLRHWLDRAFLAGQVPWGTFLFQGRPADFPFQHGEGHFEALMKAEDAVLSFHRDWPPLESVDGFVRFRNGRMDVHASSGRIKGLSILDTHAAIPDMKGTKVLEVTGSALGAFENGLAFLKETPLQKRLGTLADRFRVSGTTHLDLSLSIPLRRRGPEDRPKVDGALSWPGPASLAPTGTELELGKLKGALSFDQAGLKRSHIEAELWGSPLTTEIDRIGGVDAGERSTRLRIAGTTTAESLTRRLVPFLSGRARGAGAWTLTMEIPNSALQQDGTALDIALSSDLRGLAIDLPAPLGKTRPQTRRFQLGWKLEPGKATRMRGRYADLAFNLLFAKDAGGKRRLQRGGIAFGSRKAALPTVEGLHLTGRLASLDLPAWTRLAVPPQTGAGRVQLRSADLRIDRLVLPWAQLTGARLDLQRKPQVWNAQIEAVQLAGRVSVPHRPRGQPLRIALDRLELESLLDEGEQGGAKRATAGDDSGTDPRHSHSLSLSVERLLWDGANLGRLTIDAKPRDDGLEFSEISLDGSPLMQASGTGRWTVDDGGQTTRIDLKAEAKDLGEYLRHLGYQSLLDQAPAEAELHLAWPGGPGELSVPALDGRAEIEVGKGSLLDVDPGVGRVLGVFSLDTLHRRLSLDFSDLLDPGYAFERMYGSFDIQEGRAKIVEMATEGPSAEIRVEGTTDLVRQEFEQVVTVTPSLGTSVALAGAVAGGPLVGAAVLIADKVSGGAVDKIGRHQYEVTGPWTDPQIKRRPLVEADPGEHAFLPDRGRADVPSEPVESPAAAQKGDSVRKGRRRPSETEAAPNLFLDDP